MMTGLKWFLLVFCFLALLPACAQTVILETPPELLEEAWQSSGAEASEMTAMEIRAADLADLTTQDMTVYVKLRTLIIRFTENPEAPFSEKQIVIDMVYRNLDFLVELAVCPALENIVLQTGEMLFIRADEGLSEQEADALNLRRAVELYGPKILKILPRVTIYAHNWGW